MLHDWLRIIEEFVIAYGALGVFGASFIEEVIAPLPSTIVVMFAGFFLIPEGNFSLAVFQDLLLRIAIPVSLGVTLGSFLVYGLVYKYGRPLVESVGRYVGLSWRDIERWERYFSHSSKDELFLFLARAIPIVPSLATNVFAGLVRWNLRSYIIITFFGTMVRAFIIGWVGWRVGSLYVAYAQYIQAFEKTGLIAIVSLTTLYLFYRIWRRHLRRKS